MAQEKSRLYIMANFAIYRYAVNERELSPPEVFVHRLVGQQAEVLKNDAQAAAKEWNLATGDDAEVLAENVNGAARGPVLFNNQSQAR